MYRALNATQVFPVEVSEVDVMDVYPLHPFNYHPDNYERIKESVRKDGLLHPIVILPLSIEEWEIMKELSDGLLAPPSLHRKTVVDVVMCGNNRLQIAKDLYYTHIDAIICSSKEEVNKWCGMMRRQWRLEEKKLREQERESGRSLEL